VLLSIQLLEPDLPVGTTFQNSVWPGIGVRLLPAQQFHILKSARGAHRCFNATTTVENHPNLLIQCRITRWTPNRQGIIDCWDQERNANFPQLTQHSLQLDAEWKEWVAGTRLEFLEDANDEDNDGNKDNE